MDEMIQLLKGILPEGSKVAYMKDEDGIPCIDVVVGPEDGEVIAEGSVEIDAGDLPFTDPNVDAEEATSDTFEPCDIFACCMVPTVSNVIFSGPATTIIWGDGEKTTVKVADGQPFDKYAGFCAAVVKRLFGSSAAAKKVMDDHDAGVLRQRREEEKLRRKEEAKRAQEAQMLRKIRESYTFSDFQKEVTERVKQIAIEEAAKAQYEAFFNKEKEIEKTTQTILNAFAEEKEEQK